MAHHSLSSIGPITHTQITLQTLQAARDHPTKRKALLPKLIKRVVECDPHILDAAVSPAAADPGIVRLLIKHGYCPRLPTVERALSLHLYCITPERTAAAAEIAEQLLDAIDDDDDSDYYNDCDEEACNPTWLLTQAASYGMEGVCTRLVDLFDYDVTQLEAAAQAAEDGGHVAVCKVLRDVAEQDWAWTEVCESAGAGAVV